MNYQLSVIYWDDNYLSYLQKTIKLGQCKNDLYAINYSKEIIHHNYGEQWKSMKIRDERGYKIYSQRNSHV